MYKYKAKCIDTGEWIEGLPSYNDNGNVTEMEYDLNDGCVDIYRTDIDPGTICMGTGLRDKHTKVIWQNDIVKCEEHTGIVRFGVYDSIHYGFYIEWQQDPARRKDILFWTDKVEVIGNVFDQVTGGDGDIENEGKRI